MALLDTCVLIWLTDQQDKVTASALEIIHSDVDLYASAISAFEISLKYTAHRLNLPQPPARFYAETLRRYGITELPVTGELAIAGALLPSIHRDPADRFIVATALKHNLPVITPDKFIPQYPGVKVVW